MSEFGEEEERTRSADGGGRAESEARILLLVIRRLENGQPFASLKEDATRRGSCARKTHLVSRSVELDRLIGSARSAENRVRREVRRRLLLLE